MMRFLPSRTTIATALAGLLAFLFAWARRDARKDVTDTLEKEDLQNADEITDRVSDDRADPAGRVQDYGNTRYRD